MHRPNVAFAHAVAGCLGAAFLTLTTLSALTGCGDNSRSRVFTIHASAELAGPVAELIGYIPIEAQVKTSTNPAQAVSQSSLELAVSLDLDCDGAGDCYQIDSVGAGYSIRAATLIGAQYGLGQALEQLGVGFFHPHRTHVPTRLGKTIPNEKLAAVVVPEIAERGLHLHTLHPIEAYYAFLEPGAENLEDAKRIVNWGILIGVNYFQWLALDDISTPATAEAWGQHSKAIIDYIHQRGARVGIGIQMFGSSNLQQAFDLINDPELPSRPQIEARLPIVLGDLGWDHISLSFGEFFGADPAKFVADTNLVVTILGELAEGTTISATVHVGEDQRIEYMGRDQIYYFLVRYADPKLIPWIHTVMYYNLFEDAGGAYLHDDFEEHREYLLERIDAGEPVGYHPETAYWVAFDNSVPIYNPLYVRSRWLDLDRLADASANRLPSHIVFSTGWEWGFWQNDASAFRQSVTHAENPQQVFDQLFAPLGNGDAAQDGTALAKAAHDTAELQHEYLLGKRLSGYLAGGDLYIDLGYQLDIVSQPRPALFSEILEFDSAESDDFRAEVIVPLEMFAAGTDAILTEFQASATESVWDREMVDGLESTSERTKFVAASLRAALAAVAGKSPEADLEAMDAAFDRGRVVVDRRHAALWFPRPDLLTKTRLNSTVYGFGYLKQAEELCYWARERTDLLNRLRNEENLVEPCIN